MQGRFAASSLKSPQPGPGPEHLLCNPCQLTGRPRDRFQHCHRAGRQWDCRLPSSRSCTSRRSAKVSKKL
eukprot:12754772-Prorocentrum_lima.AAC.1